MAGDRKGWSVQGDGWSLAWDRGYLVGEPRSLPELVRTVGLLAAASGQRMRDGRPVDLGDPRIALDLSLEVLARHGLDTDREKPRRVSVLKSHCPQGHPFDEANTYTEPTTGSRRCRMCRAQRAIAGRKRRRAVSAA